MNKIKIDKDIPIPTYNPKYPFNEMEVGDSFFVDLEDKGNLTVLAKKMSRLVNEFRIKSKTESRFKTQSYIKGVRVWRIV